jgi:2-polyprenyl-6-methoxyphenol hydroxylase-like FAD-dependent oxidoreductase
MFVDAQHGFEGGRQEVDICIIGGGVAGITAALEFDGKPLSVALLESGEFKYAQATQSLYEGATVGLRTVGSGAIAILGRKLQLLGRLVPPDGRHRLREKGLGG